MGLILAVVGGAVFKAMCFVINNLFAPALKIVTELINWLLEKIINLMEIGVNAFGSLAGAAGTVAGAVNGIIGAIQSVIDWFGRLLSVSSDAANKSAANASSVRNTSYTYNNSANINVSGYTPGATPQVVSDFASPYR